MVRPYLPYQSPNGYGRYPSVANSHPSNAFANALLQPPMASGMYTTPPPPANFASSSLAHALVEPPPRQKSRTVYRPEQSAQFFDHFLEEQTRAREQRQNAALGAWPAYPSNTTPYPSFPPQQRNSVPTSSYSSLSNATTLPPPRVVTTQQQVQVKSSNPPAIAEDRQPPPTAPSPTQAAIAAEAGTLPALLNKSGPSPPALPWILPLLHRHPTIFLNGILLTARKIIRAQFSGCS
jgi:hypothetical protein